MPDLTYKLGEYQPFIAARGFFLPGHDLSLTRGEEIGFDGARALIRGQEHTSPAFRGAVKAGWLVPKDEYRPVPEFAQFKPPAEGQKIVMLGEPLNLAGLKNTTVTSSGKNYIVCRRQNVWERLRNGGALYEPCPCPVCEKNLAF